ncbi:hypothetical protein A8M32_06825 [Sinorhizobium alkalisoli]|uniref:Uncharacterized protein n=1 Tax=Sinorhizobium alkalisoli TaxID=1752398 RepID=A0A1E3VEX5_9HYPH|nr:hypothetical protein A8M32_06825 [Sinorhizobium alkalisoli]
MAAFCKHGIPLQPPEDGVVAGRISSHCIKREDGRRRYRGRTINFARMGSAARPGLIAKRIASRPGGQGSGGAPLP